MIEKTGEKPGDEAFRITTRTEVSETSCELIQSASRTIDILVHDYDEILLPNSEIGGLLPEFFLAHRQNRFRYLCSESDLLHDRGRNLVELARKYSTFIKLRQIPEHLNSARLQFLVTDSKASMVTRTPGSHDYFVDKNDRARARKLENQFEELWQRANSIPGIHVTGLSS
jgi:hypothetical protein